MESLLAEFGVGDVLKEHGIITLDTLIGVRVPTLAEYLEDFELAKKVRAACQKRLEVRAVVFSALGSSDVDWEAVAQIIAAKEVEELVTNFYDELYEIPGWQGNYTLLLRVTAEEFLRRRKGAENTKLERMDIIDEAEQAAMIHANCEFEWAKTVILQRGAFLTKDCHEKCKEELKDADPETTTNCEANHLTADIELRRATLVREIWEKTKDCAFKTIRTGQVGAPEKFKLSYDS